mgnify:CR=1 FL=1
MLKRWEEPAGPRSLTVMELSEDLDNMTKVASAIKSSSGGGGATTPKKGGAMAKKKMLQVDEVLALVIGSLLAATL